MSARDFGNLKLHFQRFPGRLASFAEGGRGWRKKKLRIHAHFHKTHYTFCFIRLNFTSVRGFESLRCRIWLGSLSLCLGSVECNFFFSDTRKSNRICRIKADGIVLGRKAEFPFRHGTARSAVSGSLSLYLMSVKAAARGAWLRQVERHWPPNV